MAPTPPFSISFFQELEECRHRRGTDFGEGFHRPFTDLSFRPAE